MMKKVVSILFITLILFSIETFADYKYIDLNESQEGVVIVNYPVESNVRYKAMLKKDGEKHYYDLVSNEVRLPLQMGEGTYEFAILRNTSGTIYSYEYETTFEVASVDEEQLYLSSHVHINWHSENDSIEFLEEFLNDDMDDLDKVLAIHKLLAETLEYDFEKYAKIKGAYLPSIDETFESRMGICYDFSSLFAAMLRSEGIQTKLIMGYRIDTPVYHAWNEILIEDEWIIVDLTLDVEYFQKGYLYEILKDEMFYEKDAEF